MARVTICLTVLSALVLAVLPIPTSAQQLQYPHPDYPFPGFPEEFSPLSTSRPAKPQRSLTPSTKFLRAANAIPNRYIVVLKDNVVASAASLALRRAGVTAVANAHAQAHLGRIGYIFETALKGYSIELPNEAAAIALSGNPQVKWVEEEGQLQWQDPDAIQTTPPWGLDAIDGTIPETCGSTTVTIKRSGNLNQAASCSYATQDGTATIRSDYAPVFGTLRFAPGEASKTISISITDNTSVRGNRSFKIALSDNEGNATFLGSIR